MLLKTFLFILSIVITNISFAFNDNSIIAVVNNEVITSNELNNSVKIYEEEAEKKIDKKTLDILLNSYIDLLIKRQAAKKIGIQVRPEILQEQIHQVAKQYNIPLSTFRQLPEYDLVVQQLTDRIFATGLKNIITKNVSTVSATLLESTYQQHLKNSVQYRLSNIILKSKEKIDQLHKELKIDATKFSQNAHKYSLAYNAKQNGDLGFRPFSKLPLMYQPLIKALDIGQVSDVIVQKNKPLYHLIKLADIKKNKDILSHQIKINHIFIPKNSTKDVILKQQKSRVLETMINIYQQLQKEIEFKHLAKIYSQDDYAKTGGELPWMSIDKLPNNGKINFNALEIGEISSPFETEHGWHIIQKIGSRHISPIKLSVKNELLDQEKNKQFKIWLLKQRKKVYIKIYQEKLQKFLAFKK